MIIIIGDSWGIGEWGLDSNEYCLTGPGIGQYLSMHELVVNLSVGFGSNSESIQRLETFLKRYSVAEEDTIYWIVTNPRRCSSPEQIAQQDQSIDSAIRSLLSNSLEQAQRLAETRNTTIKLIGGLCDLDSVDVTEYKNLSVAVPSWGKLIDENYFSSIHYYDFDWQILGSLLTTLSKKEEWLELGLECEKKQRSMMKIFPDYSHPDRLGHRQLRDFLYPEWKHKF